MANDIKPNWYKQLPFVGTFTDRRLADGSPPFKEGYPTGVPCRPWEHEWEKFATDFSFWETWSCCKCRHYLSVKKKDAA